MNSANSDIEIRYHFQRQDSSPVDYIIRLDANKLVRTNPQFDQKHESWTRLEYKQCEHCPLNEKEHPQCPAAVAISEFIDDWHGIKPEHVVAVECDTGRRRISAETSAQQGLGALLGLVLATCECPHFDFFKPMARYHLPLASPSESYYRVLGTYFIQQYFAGVLSSEKAIDDISAIYQNVEKVNRALAKRIYNMENQSAAVSAIVVLDLLAQLFAVSPEDSLKEIEGLFKR